MKPLSATQLANIEFHRRLAPQYEQQPFFQDANRQRVRALLCELAKSTPAKRLLDVGCGTGLILDLAHDLFDELDGIDITPEMLDKVTPRPNVKTQLASTQALPFPDGAFDMVTAYSVLHHIEEPGRVFREVRRTLRPGGAFYADESPSQHYLDALMALNPRSPMADAVRHERDRLLSDAGEYQRLYGVPVEVVQRAMTQNYSWHALRQEKLERLLRSAGFVTIKFSFRRFIGEDLCLQQGGEALVTAIQSHLVSLLPLTRGLFKYFVLVAR
jgi:ubiquinone/menaquinone biosynthesis C-methylase UbiE